MELEDIISRLKNIPSIRVEKAVINEEIMDIQIVINYQNIFKVYIFSKRGEIVCETECTSMFTKADVPVEFVFDTLIGKAIEPRKKFVYSNLDEVVTMLENQASWFYLFSSKSSQKDVYNKWKKYNG